MRDGTQYSTWKDFAWSLCEELDDLHENDKLHNEKYDKLREEFVVFKTTVYVVATVISTIALALFGIFEFAIN